MSEMDNIPEVDAAPEITADEAEAVVDTETAPAEESAVTTKKYKLPDKLRIALIAVFACVFLVSAYLLIDYFVEGRKQDKIYDDLSQQVDRPTRPLPDEETYVQDDSPLDTKVHYVTVLNNKTGEYVSVLPQYADLFSLNPDFAGWLQIPGTDIDYPVMQTPEDPEYYLGRNFYGAETDRGSIFADGRCDLARPSENIILHGHHMRDGTMFGSLMDYEDKSFWEEHKYIFFDTITETHTYEVIAVFISSVNAGADFPYYQFVDSDEIGYDSFIRLCKKNALYDTGVDAVYGENLLTLSTCEYTADNNRFVVVAKCID